MRVAKYFGVLARIAGLLLLLLVLGGLVDYGYMYWRASQGYCDRTGEKLSTARRFDIALDDYLSNQQTADLLEIRALERKDNPSLEEMREHFTLIEYAGREEFLAENPDCCRLTWLLPEGDRIGFWEKAKDSGDGYFRFEHKIRYTRPDGARREIIARRVYYQVTNCGGPRLRVF